MDLLWSLKIMDLMEKMMVAIEELYAIYKKMGFAFVDENADISKCNQKMYMTIS